MADCGVLGYDQRWHSEIDETVKSDHKAIHGNGDLGLKSRMTTVETYIVESRDERKAMRKWLLGIVAGILLMIGERAFSDFHIFFQPQSTQTQTSSHTDIENGNTSNPSSTTTTDSSSSTTHKH